MKSDLPFIPLGIPHLKGNEAKYVAECIRTGWVSSAGGFVERFEREFAARVGARHAVATCSGTAALHTALVLLGIGPGDEVLVPTLTFVASANPVRYVGAKPVFVDSEPETWNLDPEQMEARITSRTRAVVVVHLFGHTARMDAILRVAAKHKLAVIEDATESLGSYHRGRHTGTFGDIGCFSFNGNKVITTGGGGMLVTRSAQLARRARFLTTQARASDTEYFHPEVGFNYRLTNIQAALGVAQLEQLDTFLARKRRFAAMYEKAFRDVAALAVPAVPEGCRWNHWMNAVLVDAKKFGVGRAEMIRRLNREGIQSRPFFMPVHLQPPYRSKKTEKLPVAEKLYASGVCLPGSVGLRMSDIQRVTEAVMAMRRAAKK